MIIIGTIIAVELTIILFYILFKELNKPKKSTNKSDDVNIDTIRLLFEKNSIETIDSILDSMITDSANYYKTLVLSQDETQYITPEEIDKMSLYIFGMTMKRMSDNVINCLKLSHKIESQKDLEELIQFRIKLYMIVFASEYNRPLQ